MAKFYVSMKVELRANVEIEAETLEDAVNTACYGYTELGDLNEADIVEYKPVNISDENSELLYEI